MKINKLTFFFLFIWFIYSSCNEKNNAITNVAPVEQNNISGSIFNYAISSENEKIKDDLIVQDTSGAIVNISKLSQQKPFLLYRLSAGNCNECLSDQFKLLSNMAADDNSAQIAILIDYASVREMKVFQKAKNLKCKVYKIYTKIGLRIEDYMVYPYSFVLDKNKAEMVFTPVEKNAEQFTGYLKDVNERFLKSNL